MAKRIKFGNQSVIEPGAYSRIISGVNQRPITASSGNILIIDTGSEAGWGSLSGISGEFDSGKNSIYEFDNAKDFQQFMVGGTLSFLAPYLFKPSRRASGVNSVLYVSAKKTTAPEAEVVFTNGGSFVIKSRTEGLAGNAVVKGGNLLRGYRASIKKDSKYDDRFVLEISKGTFKGVNTFDGKLKTWSATLVETAGALVERTGIPFYLADELVLSTDPLVEATDGWAVLESNADFYSLIPSKSKPTVVYTSKGFTNIPQLIDYIQNDIVFNSMFAYEAGDAWGETTTIVDADLTSVDFAGGTDTYDAEALDLVLDAIEGEDFSFILSSDFDSAANSANNLKLVDYASNLTQFRKAVVIGVGSKEAEFELLALPTAESFDSSSVIAVYGSVKLGKRVLPSYFTAALVLGRIAGLEPQVPGTWKDLMVDGVDHLLTKKQREKAIESGVIHLLREGSEWVINQSINTLQGEELVNEVGDSYEISIERIKTQLNRDIVYNIKEARDGNGNRVFIGSNRASVTDEDVRNYVIGLLNTKVADKNTDNIILSFRDVNVTLVGESYEVTYNFEPNGPVNKLLVTGVVVDTNLTN